MNSAIWRETDHAGSDIRLRIRGRPGADRASPPGWCADSRGSRSAPPPQRGRMPRLAVIDAAAVDGRRRLVLVRRDNVEHLLMIGGPTDIVVEANIVRAMQRPGASANRRRRHRAAVRRPTAGATAEPPRPEALDHAGAATARTAAAPGARPVRSPTICAALHADAFRERTRRSDPLSGFTPEPMGAVRSRARSCAASR